MRREGDLFWQPLLAKKPRPILECFAVLRCFSLLPRKGYLSFPPSRCSPSRGWSSFFP